MTKIDVISGFLGAGKTTLIRKLLEEALQGEQIVLIENEFGEIGIDGGFLKDAGVNITEMSQGCICCSLVGDFGKALRQVVSDYHPDRVIIEPSGVGKLSDVMAAVNRVAAECEIELNSATTVADANKCKVYMKNFGEFYDNQIENAGAIVLSRTQFVSEERLAEVVALLRSKNAKARIITTPWDELDGKKILSAMEDSEDLTKELLALAAASHDDEDDDDEDEHEHHHHHHHHDDEDEHEHEDHHHHDDDDDDEAHEHHHHHHYDENGVCSCGHHHHHHGHDADEIFTSWGQESPKKFEKETLDGILEKLSESSEFGMILRAKGMVPLTDGSWAYFDLVPGEYEIRNGEPEYTGKFCVIGSELKEDGLKELFGL